MKRIACLIVSFFIIILTLPSCETILSVDAPLIEANSNGSSASITLDVNKDWTASCSADWCDISPTKGDKDVKSIRVSVQSNKTYSDRVCLITIVSKDKSITVSVKQVQNDELLVETSDVTISDKQQSFAVNVSSNIKYSVSIESSWIKHIGTKALTPNTLTFEAEANNTMDARTGIIKLIQNGGSIERDVVVKQKQKDSIIVSANSISFDWNNATTSIGITANVDFQIKIPEDCGWLHADRTGSKREYQLNVYADDFILTPYSNWNTDYPAREGIITLTAGDVTKQIAVSQRFRDYIWISQDNLELYEGFSASITTQTFLHSGINHNLVWESNNEDVATVEEGNIVAVSKGQAIITVRNQDNSFSAQCIVNVKKVIDDVYIRAQGKNLHQYSSYFELKFHSRIYFPSVVKSVEYYSVWLCQPDGTVYDIKGTYDGYVEFKPVYWTNSTLNQWDLDYFCRWYVIYQVVIDGELHELYQNLNAHLWSSSI